MDDQVDPASSQPRRAGVGPGGIPPRRTDPATRHEIFAPKVPDPEVHRQVARDAKSLRDALEGGETQWEPLLRELSASQEALDIYWACSSRHLTSSCEVDLRMTFVPDGRGRGTITYVGIAEDSSCPDYARCLADAYVGRSVPLPAAVQTPLGHHMVRIDNEIQGLVDHPEALARTIELLEDEVAALERSPDGHGRPDWGLLVAEQRARLELLRRLRAHEIR